MQVGTATEVGRTLKTARSVLRVLALLETTPQGMTAAEVAQAIGRSRSTATNLLNTLVAEGFALHDEFAARYLPRAARPPSDSAPIRGTDAIDPTVIRALYERTNERAYLALTDDRGVTIEDSRGRQGLPYVPGLSPAITRQAHALAVGKAVLAHLGPDAVRAYTDAYGLTAFTSRTITDPGCLEEQLATVRDRGVAVDIEEFAPGFCCIASPILGDDQVPIGAVAISVNAARFRANGRRLADEVAAAAQHALGRMSQRLEPD